MNKSRRQTVLEKREKYRLTTTEQKIAILLAKFIVVILAIAAYLIRALLKGLFKLKRWLFRLAIVILITYSALNALTTITYAPYAHATEFQYVKVPQTQHDKIVNYIYDVFGKDAEDAFKVLSCENNALKTDAQNYNSDGSVDIGIFQINSVHQVNKVYLYDWRTNISVGYHIFKDSGWSAWTCAKRMGVI